MFKTETHLHVSEVSSCSKISAEDMVKLYHKAGYKTLIVSDHFQEAFFKRLGDIFWDEKVEKFLVGYRNAKEAAKKVCMNIIFSVDINFNNWRNNYLLY